MAPKILIVDDEPELLDVVAEAMEGDGYAVTVVGDGLAALDKLAETSFDVVITDLVMPGLSGLDVAESVKRTSPSTAVILVTAWIGTAERARVAQTPIDATLAKPFDVDTLMGVTRSALRTVTGSQASSAHGPRILLIEEDSVDVNVISVMLGSANCRVDTARDARHALTLACAHPYDLVLVDCRASEAEACKLSASLRQSGGVNALVPVVAITNEPVRAARDMYFRAGMDDVLPRPLTSRALSATVRRWARSAPVLDQDALGRLRTPGENQGVFEGMIARFLSESATCIAALRIAAVGGDVRQLAEVARGLRQTCSTLGALAMADACRELEKLAAADSVVGTVVLVDRLAWELTRVRWVLQRVEVDALPGRPEAPPLSDTPTRLRA